MRVEDEVAFLQPVFDAAFALPRPSSPRGEASRAASAWHRRCRSRAATCASSGTSKTARWSRSPGPMRIRARRPRVAGVRRGFRQAPVCCAAQEPDERKARIDEQAHPPLDVCERFSILEAIVAFSNSAAEIAVGIVVIGGMEVGAVDQHSGDPEHSPAAADRGRAAGTVRWSAPSAPPAARASALLDSTTASVTARTGRRIHHHEIEALAAAVEQPAHARRTEDFGRIRHADVAGGQNEKVRHLRTGGRVERVSRLRRTATHPVRARRERPDTNAAPAAAGRHRSAALLRPGERARSRSSG